MLYVRIVAIRSKSDIEFLISQTKKTIYERAKKSEESVFMVIKGGF